ncbi:MAG TPA: DMT family transporter [Candidatus Cloacimonadota bacterium]|nr:DMT family transporter [Candidatus Cloacimonadota bacterium]
MTSQNKAFIYAGFAVLFWSTAAAAFKYTLRYLDPVEMLFFASLTASSILFLMLFLQKKLILLKSYTGRDFLHSAFLGLLNPFLYYLMLFRAYSLLPGQVAQPLNFVWPLMIVLLSVPLLRQKITTFSLLAIIISLAGVIIISTQGKLLSMRMANTEGVILALSSSLLWALFFILNVRHKHDETVKLFLSFSFGFLFILPVFLLRSHSFCGKGIPGAVYIGLFEMGITFVIWVKALKLSRTTAQVNNLIYLTPFLALIFLHVIIGEIIHFSTFIGLILIVTGIVIQRNLGEKHRL